MKFSVFIVYCLTTNVGEGFVYINKSVIVDEYEIQDFEVLFLLSWRRVVAATVFESLWIWSEVLAVDKFLTILKAIHEHPLQNQIL